MPVVMSGGSMPGGNARRKRDGQHRRVMLGGNARERNTRRKGGRSEASGQRHVATSGDDAMWQRRW